MAARIGPYRYYVQFAAGESDYLARTNVLTRARKIAQQVATECDRRVVVWDRGVPGQVRFPQVVFYALPGVVVDNTTNPLLPDDEEVR